MQLEPPTPQAKKGSYLFAQPSYCLTIPLSLGVEKLQTLALLDFGTSASFLDREFVKLHKISLVQKSNPVHVEVIDGHPLSSGKVTHETMLLKIAFDGHRSTIIFNIIRTPSNPVILGLSWLEKYNRLIDWKSRRLTFTTSQIEKPTKNSQFNKLLYIGARAFIKAAKH